MTRLKATLVALALIAALALPNLRFVRSATWPGLAVQPAVTYACTGSSSSCGG
jgi:hypothetical protein